jgi:4-diphosphocytidyl-2-C-methyl-D-erythritol kinase
LNTLTLNSWAKVNLFLYVLNKRPDKFHSIKTLFERISLCDRIVLRKRMDGAIVFQCNDPKLPGGADNLAVKAALALSQRYPKHKGVTIKLIKHIPVGAGLGGGSGNAATVLLGLNKLWNLRLSIAELARLGAQIGSDVPFFVYNCRFAWATGRGEKIKPIPGSKKCRFWHVIVVPKIHVSTPLIYRHWDKLSAGKNIDISRLTSHISDVKIKFRVLRTPGACCLDKILFNSLEAVTVDLYPQVAQVKQALASKGFKNILMSGSGPAVFGIAASRKEAVDFSIQLKKEHQMWQVFVAVTV